MKQINPKKVNYRSVIKADFEQLTEIYQEAFGPDKTGDKWTLESSRAHMQEVFESLNNQYCFVAEVDDEIIGYIFAYETNMEEGKELFLDIIAVRPSTQDLGVGTRLWDLVMENVKKNKLKAIRLIASPKMPSYKWYLEKGMVESDWVEMIIRSKSI